MTIRLAIVDDHPVVVGGLRSALADVEDLDGFRFQATGNSNSDRSRLDCGLPPPLEPSDHGYADVDDHGNPDGLGHTNADTLDVGRTTDAALQLRPARAPLGWVA